MHKRDGEDGHCYNSLCRLNGSTPERKISFFPVQQNLMAMAVSPDDQRKGIGRLCIDETRRIAGEWPSDAIRLDAYDAAAGAGEFYRKCGFKEVGRATYRNVPLIYFEILVRP